MGTWNLDALDRRELIRLTLDVASVTTRMPCHMVTLDDLPAWVAELGVPYVLVRLRDNDGRVDVHAGGSYRGQYTTVHTTVDEVRDWPLPPDGTFTRLLVSDLSRLRTWTAVTA